jgi:hypothetical protein
VYRFVGRSQDATAEFYSWAPNEEISGYVHVFQDWGGGTDATGLHYSVWSCNWANEPPCEPLQEGYGPIPAQDVSFSANSVTLSTNTSAEANPDFFRWSGDGGPVEVTWDKTSFYSTHSIWNDQSTYGNLRSHSHGNGTDASASASGSIVETAFVSGWAEIGSAQSVNMEISVANVVSHVSGNAHFTTAGGELRTMSFHALQTADGRVGGEWQRYNRSMDAMAHGKVTCMTIDGNQAWLGGHSTRTTTTPGDVGWRVLDDGTGAGAEDLISMQPSGRYEGFAEDYCWEMGDWPQLRPIGGGQIRIKQ